MRVKTVKIFRSFYKDRLISISKSHEDAQRDIKESFWYDEYPDGPFTVDSIVREIFVVLGELHNWAEDGAQNYHVNWSCPKCKKLHHTDVDERVGAGQLWFCELGTQEDIFYVVW